MILVKAGGVRVEAEGVRARFAAVPLVLLGLPLAVFYGVEAREAYAERRAEREMRERAAAATALIRDVRLDGMTECVAAPVGDGRRCLRGTGDVRTVARAVEDALRAGGATGVTAGCRGSGQRSLCTVVGTAGRADVHATVGPYFEARRITGSVEVHLMPAPTGL